MKKTILSLFALFQFATTSFALEVSVSYATFKSPQQNYVEIYLHVMGGTVDFVPVEGQEGKLQAAVDVVLMFKQGETIVKFDKYRLNSPYTEQAINFIDLKRYSLQNGHYDLEVSFRDVHNDENHKQYNTSFNILFSEYKLEQSDIQLLASYKKAEEEDRSPLIKNGLYLECLPYNFYDKNTSKLIFYNEIYNADKTIGEDFMVSYSIERVKGNGDTETVKIGHKRRKPNPICVLLLQMDIATLPSGNYNLVLEVRDRSKALLSKKSIFFQRSNPYLNASGETMAEGVASHEEFVSRLSNEELRYSIKAIAPLVDLQDGELVNLLIKDNDPKAMRLYLFSFWATQNPTNPKKAYDDFMKVAHYADETFNSGFGYGFESDRGYIFIKYGAPDDIVTEENEPSAPPYQIWIYNDFPYTKQTNVKFLFYDPSLSVGGYVLLHSTARGEINNPRWEVELYRDAPNEIDGNFLDGTQMKDNFRRNARRYFREF